MSSKIGLVIEPKLLRIIQLFLNKEDEIFNLQKISSEAKVPLGSTFRLMKKITKTDLVETIPVGKTKLYRTNKKIAKEFMILK
jgi:Mn-dependent DtxR family transcriptional regulator